MFGEEGFRALFDLAADAMFIVDPDGTIRDINQIAHQQLGYEKAEMVGRNVASLILPEFAAKLEQRFEKVHRNGYHIYESAQLRKDGSILPVEVCSRGVELGGQQRIFSIVRDITERKRLYDELSASEERFRTLAAEAPEAITIHDLDSDLVIDATTSAERLFGYPREVLLRNTPAFVHAPVQPAGSPPVGERKERGLRIMAGEKLQFERRVRKASGEDILCEVTLVRLPAQNRRLVRASYVDITERKQAELALKESEAKWRMLFENMTSGFALQEVIQDARGRITDCRLLEINSAYEQITGLKADEAIGRTLLELMPDMDPHWIAVYGQVAQTGAPVNFESYCKVKKRWWQARVFSPESGRVAVVMTDTTEHKAFEEKLRLYSLVLENSSEGMVVTDADNLIVAVNPAFTNLTGYTFDEVAGRNPRMFKSGRHDDAFYRQMWEDINTSGRWQGEIWDRHRNGSAQAKWLSINTIYNDDGTVHRYVALFSDITKKKKTEELIWRQANFDALTGLPNREMFRDRLEQEMKKADREKLPLALLLIDLDQFKEVNDTLGHAFGDRLLQEAATRIRSCVRDTDTVARLGGDEFTVVLSAMPDTGHIENIAQKIIAQLTDPFRLGNEQVYISASIGITIYPDDATDISVLLKNADQAMYAAKNEGRNRFSYFTHSMQAEAQSRLRLINDMRTALEAGQFRLHFQPIVDLNNGQVCKAEALIRWQHPERGMVSPAEFIPVAEETGMIREIGDWVLMESLRWTRHFSELCQGKFQLSVNISPLQFQRGSRISEEWLDYFEKLQVPGNSIVIEITESLLLNAESGVIDKLLRFRDEGIQVAIDDFGTGYSSLAYLKKFDIDYLKIDRSFVYNLETDADNMVLCEAIIVMAHRLGLKVIAEGVETEAQRSLLAAAGCDFAQGYLFSTPVPPREFIGMLNSSTLH